MYSVVTVPEAIKSEFERICIKQGMVYVNDESHRIFLSNNFGSSRRKMQRMQHNIADNACSLAQSILAIKG